MTAGEIAMCRLIVKDAIDYSKVKIHKGAFMPGAGGNAMTPFGEPHFPVLPKNNGYQDDFSIGSVSVTLKIWFIHEMVHVWQYQMGYGVASHGIWISLKGGYRDDGKDNNKPPAYRYDYKQNPSNKVFSDFNMEQQGDIVAEYFASEFLKDSRYFNSYQFNKSVLQIFLRNPKNESLVPNTTDF